MSEQAVEHCFFAGLYAPIGAPERPVPPGFHAAEVHKTRWVVPIRYENLQALGEGAYGVVCTADDMLRGEKVAIKKFSRPFQSTIHAKRTHRELKLLRSLRHDNVIEMIDVFTPDPDPSTLTDVYFVSLLTGADLQNILKIQRLNDEQIQLLIYQVLRGLKYIHSAGIIHRDLKPSNIAVNEKCDVKILDFGLARPADSEMTGYVATRWYRAPEIMLNWMHYTQTVDVWSVGCILAELVSGRALFPGDDHIDQLTRIMTVVGTPVEDFLQKIQSDEARNYIRNLPKMPRKDFRVLFPTATDAAVDLLERTLVLDPDHRISVTEALAHPYVSKYASPVDEPVSEEMVVIDEEEEAVLSIPQWQEGEEMSLRPGFYSIELNHTVWSVPEYYQNLTPVGTGAYGTVCAAECTRTGEKVAIKKFSRPFQSNIHAKRTHRELKLLRHMNHENIIDLIDVFTPDVDPKFMNDVYIVSMLMGADLANILKIQRLSDDHIQFLIYQILRGLKILDFGLARQTDSEMTGYVATRWYRAPEIMLNWMHYTQTVDIWSVGCILAELITGKTLFPGADHIDQLTRIMSVTGTPNEEFLAKISSEEARNYIRNLPKMPRKDFRKLFPTASPDAVDLLEKTLNLDPDLRPTAKEAMEHPYLAQYHDPSDEPTAEPMPMDDERDLPVDDWRLLIWDEIEDFHRCKQDNDVNMD